MRLASTSACAFACLTDGSVMRDVEVLTAQSNAFPHLLEGVEAAIPKCGQIATHHSILSA